MRGIIITNQYLGHNLYKVNRFKEEFAKLGVEIEHFKNDGTLAKIEDGNIVFALPKCDFVIYLDKDTYLASLLEKGGHRLFNKTSTMRLCDDKTLTNIYCANHDIRMPKTLAAPLIYIQKLEEEHLTFIDKVIQELGLPLVVKRNFGSLGLGVFLVKTKEELIDVYKKNCNEGLQFQEYIKTSYGRSIRILCIDGEIIGGFERFNETDFRSNFGTHASSKILEKPEIYYEFAKKVSNIMNLEYAGIDLLYGENDEPILCEINSNAFFEEFEKTTKINVAKKFAEMVIRKINYEQKQK